MKKTLDIYTFGMKTPRGGTTGYGFAAYIDGVLVDQDSYGHPMEHRSSEYLQLSAFFQGLQRGLRQDANAIVIHTNNAKAIEFWETGHAWTKSAKEFEQTRDEYHGVYAAHPLVVKRTPIKRGDRSSPLALVKDAIYRRYGEYLKEERTKRYR